MHGSAIQWFPVICQGTRGGGSDVTIVYAFSAVTG
jgi:hypothetical protein